MFLFKAEQQSQANKTELLFHKSKSPIQYQMTIQFCAFVEWDGFPEKSSFP